MRGLVLSLLIVGSVGFMNEARGQMVCTPGPVMSCVNLIFVNWAEGPTDVYQGHAYTLWYGGFSGLAAFNPAHGIVMVAFEQLVTGTPNALCRSTAYPYDGLATGTGTIPCIFSFNLEASVIAPDGGFWVPYNGFFNHTTAPKYYGPIGEPVTPLQQPRVLGLAAWNWGNRPGPDSPPDLACGGGFYGDWLPDRPCIGDSNVVPEPSTVILLGSGLLGLGFVAWRRKEEED